MNPPIVSLIKFIAAVSRPFLQPFGVYPEVTYEVHWLDYQKCWVLWSDGFSTYQEAREHIDEQEDKFVFRVSARLEFETYSSNINPSPSRRLTMRNDVYVIPVKTIRNLVSWLNEREAAYEKGETFNIENDDEYGEGYNGGAKNLCIHVKMHIKELTGVE